MCIDETLPAAPQFAPAAAIRAGLLALMVAPWLFPFALGPTPSVNPWLFAAACAVFLIWLSRYLRPTDIGRAWQWAAALSALAGIIQFAGWAHMFAPWIASATQGAVYGNLRQRNQFATLCMIGWVGMLYVAHTQQAGRSVWNKWNALGLTALLMGANALSASRTGLLDLLCLTLVWMLACDWRPRLWKMLLTGAWGAYAFVALVLPLLQPGGAGWGIAARLEPQAVDCESRITLWRHVIHLIAQHPYTGWGWGELDYAHFISPYGGTRFCGLLDNAHNLPLHLAVELGLPAAVALCGAVGVWVWRRQPWTEKDAVKQGAWLVLALLAVHSLLEYPLWYGPFQMALALSVWLLCRPDAGGVRGADSAIQAVVRGSALGLALLFLAYAAWDYRRVSQIYLPWAERDAPYQTRTLEQAQESWLFRDQAQFARFLMEPLSAQSATDLHVLGWRTLHFSPEPLVVEKLLLVEQFRGDEAAYNTLSLAFAGAYPKDYQRWQTLPAKHHAVRPVSSQESSEAR